VQPQTPCHPQLKLQISPEAGGELEFGMDATLTLDGIKTCEKRGKEGSLGRSTVCFPGKGLGSLLWRSGANNTDPTTPGALGHF
jgi:hypothetical protein